MQDTLEAKYKAVYEKVNDVVVMAQYFMVFPFSLPFTLSMLSTRYHSFFQTLKLIWYEEGGRGLYGGMAAHLLRVIPNTAIMFLGFEAILRIMEGHSHP